MSSEKIEGRGPVINFIISLNTLYPLLGQLGTQNFNSFKRGTVLKKGWEPRPRSLNIKPPFSSQNKAPKQKLDTLFTYNQPPRAVHLLKSWFSKMIF